MNIKHGLSNTPEYKCWQQIKARCLNPDHAAFPDYGGRGISVFEGWHNDFLAFLDHVGHRPSNKHSLDRIDVNLGYVPGNLRWATPLEQNNNRRPHRPHGVRVHHPTRSDGKPTNFKHGMIHTPEYNAWTLMKDRCLNPNSANYPYWGGRGITICEAWVDDFPAFYRDMGPRPSPLHSLDRKDNSRGYEPQNCRWATKLEQTENRRPCRTGPEHGNFDHGHAGTNQTPEYKVWTSIKTRCFNEKHDRYSDYGGRGVTMCEGWRDDFPAFLRSLGVKPSARHTVMREDLNGNYSCGTCEQCLANGWVANCRWADKAEQNRHRRPSSRSGKLDLEKVRVIRERFAAGVRDATIAREFGVGATLIGKIRRGEVWR